MWHVSLEKSSEYGVQIRGRPLFALLLPQPGEQGSHWSAFVRKDADVALRFSQVQRLGKDGEGILPRCLGGICRVAHVMSQGLQDLHLDDVAPAFLLLRAHLQRFQEREGLRGLLLGQQRSHSCHLLAFTCQWGGHAVLLRKFLRPANGTFHFSTGQPELDPIHDEEGSAPVRAVVFRQGRFCLLEGQARCVQLPSCQVDTHQDRIC